MTDGSLRKVFVVLDRAFGDRLTELSRNFPVWIVDSPNNQAAVKLSWIETPVSGHCDGMTLFKAFDTASPEVTLLDNLSTIDLHHGEHSAPVPYSVLEVIGLFRTPMIEAALATYGFHQFEATTDGFRATRI